MAQYETWPIKSVEKLMTSPTPVPARKDAQEIWVKDAKKAGANLLWRSEKAYNLPLSGLRLIDLRRPGLEECKDPKRTEMITNVKSRYDTPVTARDDRLFEGQGFRVYRGQIWSGRSIIDHTFYHGLRGKFADQYDMMSSFERRSSIEKIDGSAMFIQKPGSGNYFHWMIECLPRLKVLDDVDLLKRVDRLLLHLNPVPNHVKESIHYFFPDMIERLHPYRNMLAIPEKLLFFTAGPRKEGMKPETRISSTSAKFLSELDRPDRPGENIIFISRANASNRRLVNEQDLIEFLSSRFPVKVMIGDKLSVADQRKIMASARAIVGVHGAGLTNLIFAPRGARLIELTQGQYLNRTASFHDSALICGIEPHLVLAEEHGERTEVVKNVGNDLWLDPAAFEKISEIISY
ncbi:glycosyltransferase family 61 protein [Paracoccus nototheniae]|uniref:Glycosyltransferase family 61 protein n=1 Tax=Paracoccus nototheniae TaxID=2489002 RepID=A0ABW4E1Q3_9RHOB|nr:glycosyltransferase family 61 protein [Paracoccus nototheniae]